jgi:hypothetical protein
MTKLASSILAVVILGVGVGIAGAADSDNETKPTMDERFTEAAVKGTLMQIGKEYVWVTDRDGNEITLHVEKSTTKQDKGRVGNTFRSNKTTKRHTTTAERASIQ